ncbi:MAG: hypothetical protein LBL01_06335 [Bifidobacteriaceae bacterium]|nr:hypothetical protein [Bifidobacteriaceae bacterium]
MNAGPSRAACPQCFAKAQAAGEAKCRACGAKFPPGWAASHVTTVVMAGARASGKSHYIASMVPELSHYIDTTFAASGATLSPMGETRDHIAEHYIIPVTGIDPRTREPAVDPETGRPVVPQRLKSTPPQDGADAHQKEPLIWSMGEIGGITRYLVVRDVAGEDLKQPVKDDRFPFLKRADALLMLFDPLTVPGVNSLLRDEQREEVGPPADLIWDNIRALRDSLGPGSPWPMVGVVLAKFDELQALKDKQDVEWSYIMSNAGARFFQEQPPEARPHLDQSGRLVPGNPTDAIRLSEEIESLLDLAGGHKDAFLARVKPFNPQFFAVSSLGSPIRGMRIAPEGVCRFRVLDPLTWVFNVCWFRAP